MTTPEFIALMHARGIAPALLDGELVLIEMALPGDLAWVDTNFRERLTPKLLRVLPFHRDQIVAMLARTA